jgi:hypothetical protein
MADSAGGYNPGTSMLQTNPDASLKVFMGGGMPGSDGGAGLDYRNDVSMLQQNPGAVLQKFEGGAITVPGAKGEGRLLEDVMQLTDTKPYTERNYVVRSVEELREKFGNEVAYNDFILWLGRKLKGNSGFEEFVKARFLRIEETDKKGYIRRPLEVRLDELQAKLRRKAVQLESLQTKKEKLQEDKKAKTLQGDIAEADIQLAKVETELATSLNELTGILDESNTATSESTSASVPAPVVVEEAPAPVVEEAPVVVEEAPVIAPTVEASAPAPESSLDSSRTDVKPSAPASGTQGGARKPKRTLKRASKKARRTYKRK